MSKNKKSKKKATKRDKRRGPANVVDAAADTRRETTAGGNGRQHGTAGEPPPNKRVVRFNRRLVLIALAVGAVLAAGMHFVHDFQVERNADALLERANAAEEAGELDEARRHLSHYVGFRPDDIDALARLAKLVHQTAPNEGRAQRRLYFRLDEVLRRDPSRDEIRRLLVEVAMKLGRYRNALQHIDELRSRFPEDVELVFLSAQCQQAQGNASEAADLYLRAIELAPTEVDHYIGLAMLVTRRPEELPLLPIHRAFADSDELRTVAEAAAENGPQTKPGGEATDPKTESQAQSENGKDANETHEKSESEAARVASAEGFARVVADHILARMVEHGRPQYEARLARAGYWMDESASTADRWLNAENPERRAATLLADLDSNEDGVLDPSESRRLPMPPSDVDTNEDGRIAEEELVHYYVEQDVESLLDEVESNRDEVLEPSEWPRLPMAPSIVDADEDRRLTKSELMAYYTAGGRQAQLQAAQDDVRVALEEAPQDPEVLRTAALLALARARLAEQQRETEQADRHIVEARQHATQGLKIEPPELQFHHVLARVEIQADNLDEAEAQIRRGLERLPDVRENAETAEQASLDRLKTELQTLLVDVLIAQSQQNEGARDEAKLAEARRLVDELRLANASRSLLAFLKGRLLFVQRKWHQASLLLQESRSGLSGRPELIKQLDLALNTCYARLNNPDAQLDVFRRALRENPLWLQGRLGLAQVLASLNRWQEAIDEYRTISGVPGVPAAMARLILQQQRLRPPEQRETGWKNINRMLAIEEQMRTRRDLPESVDVPLLRAEARIQQNKFDEARTLLEDARQAHPEEPRIWNALSLLALVRENLQPADRVQTATEIVQKGIQRAGDSVELRLAAANVAIRQPAEEARLSLAELESKTDQFTEEEQARLFEGLAAAYIRIGDRSEARRLWTRLAELRPDRLEPRLALVELAQQDDDRTALRAFLKDIREIEGPGGPNGNYVEAVMLMQEITRNTDLIRDGRIRDAEKLQEALKRPRELLTEAARQRRYWAAVPRLLGNLENLAGNRELAVEHYQRAIELGDRSRQVVVRVVRYLYEQQRFDEADAMIRRLSETAPSLLTGDLARLAWRVAWRKQRYDEALGRAEVAAQSQDVRDQIWLGQLRFARGERGEAVEKPLRKAVDLALKNDSQRLSAAYFALVAYLSRVDQLDEAEAVIRNAAGKLPKDPPESAPVTLARCFEVLHTPARAEKGYREKAEELYLQAVAAKPEDVRLRIVLADFYTRHDQFDEAEGHLDYILDPKNEAPDYAVSWARRRRAGILAARGSYAETRKALDMLEDVTADPEEASLEDLKAKAQILARSNLRRDRLALIDLLKEIDTRQPLPPADRFQLARLYEAVDNWPQAREILEGLLQEHPGDGLVLAQLIQGLIRADDLDLAETRLERLKGVMPDSFIIVMLQGRLLRARGKAEEAVPLVKRFLDQQRIVASPEQAVRDLLAQNRAEEALKELEQYAAEQDDTDAAQALDEARRLLADGNNDEAIDLLTQYLQREELQKQIRQYYFRVAARLLAEWDQLADAESVFREYLKQSDRPADVLVLASYVARQGRVEEALDLYEKAWENEDISQAAVASSIVATLRIAKEPAAEHVQRVEAQLQAVLDADPESVVAVFLADLRDFQGRYDEAEQIYREVLSRNDRNVMALNNLAWLWALQSKNPQAALKHVNRAIQIAGPAAELLDTRAIVYLSRSEPAQAVDDLEDAVASDPSPVKYFHLAQAYLQSGDREAAKNAYADALDAGFSEENLHPLERQNFREIAAQLAQIE